jgi:hypothetical protein
MHSAFYNLDVDDLDPHTLFDHIMRGIHSSVVHTRTLDADEPHCGVYQSGQTNGGEGKGGSGGGEGKGGSGGGEGTRSSASALCMPHALFHLDLLERRKCKCGLEESSGQLIEPEMTHYLTFSLDVNITHLLYVKRELIDVQMAGIELDVGDESHSGSKNVMFDDMLKLVRKRFWRRPCPHAPHCVRCMQRGVNTVAQVICHTCAPGDFFDKKFIRGTAKALFLCDMCDVAHHSELSQVATDKFQVRHTFLKRFIRPVCLSTVFSFAMYKHPDRSLYRHNLFLLLFFSSSLLLLLSFSSPGHGGAQ